jgi:PAP2 superfamily
MQRRYVWPATRVRDLLDSLYRGYPSARSPGRPFSFSNRRAQWGAVAALGAVVALWCAVSDFRPDWSGWFGAAGVVAILTALAAYYRHFRKLQDDRIPETLDAAAVLVAYSAVGAAVSYLMASLGWPLIDTTLASWDARLAFDWVAYFRTIAPVRPVAYALTVLYASLLPQVALATVGLGFLGQTRAVREMMGLLITTSLPIVVLSGFLPAESAWIHHGLGRELAYHLPHFVALRDGTLRLLAPADAVGLITFPSFHTAMALIIPWACRGLPWLFWPVATFNVGVLASIPSFGGHYFVDMVAGAAITMAAMAWTSWADRRRAAAVGTAVDALAGGR